MAAGADLGVADAGYYAIESLRLEKGYRAFGRELTPDYGPVEAGLVFATASCGTDKDFLGRARCSSDDRAAGRRRSAPTAGVVRRRRPRRRCSGAASWCCATACRPGQVTSAAWGATVGACVGLAYLRADGPVTADLAGARVASRSTWRGSGAAYACR